MSVPIAIIRMRIITVGYCIRCLQHHSYRTPHGCVTLADIQNHQRLAQDSPIHFHPGLILQPFLQGRWYEPWLLTDNGTVPPCYVRSADRCSNFSEISQSHHVTSTVLIPAPLLCLVVALNCLADSGPI